MDNTILDEYLKFIGFTETEGHVNVPEQIEDLINLTSKPNIKILEIGFNGGHSSNIILSNNETAIVYSFDLGDHKYVYAGKEFIDFMHPGRHHLIIGDSTVTIPNFIKYNNIKFDIIFIDGGHQYEVAKADLENCFYLSKPDTIVIMDDVVYDDSHKKIWHEGPTIAWLEAIRDGKIVEYGNFLYKSIDHGMAYGIYL